MIEVTKRDGRIEKFDIWKIRQVVMLAISQAGLEFEIEDVYDISTLVGERVKNRDKISVEEISDIVERVLAENGYFEASKAYILYRDMRNRERLQEGKPGLLSNEFLSKYKKRKEPFNQLGAFVFYRTYSRFLPEKGRREYWWETVRRVVEFNCGLAPTSVKEAEMIYDNIFNLRQVPSGRALFTGGTEASQKYRLSCFNCSFLVLDSFEKYSELFYLLLVGAGVGIRVLKEDVAQLPKIRTDIEVVHEAYKAKPVAERAEYTSVTFKGNQAHIYIGDSKEAWKQALDHFFDIFSKQEYYKVKQIIFNYDNVRPKGERLKTFGGRSSGYESMQEMFEGIVKVISKYESSKVQLKPIDCMDIANLIGVNVVSGGTRRSSEIILFSPDDEEIKNAKSNLYVNDNGHWSLNQEIAHRTLSNNSVYYESKPTFEEWEKHMKAMRFSGEPGFVNAEYGKKIREDFMGCNPCFTGDMKLLTEDGYKTFRELDGTKPMIINPDGKATKGKVWCNGEKEVIELTLRNGNKIRCTPNHVFMSDGQFEIQAKDTVGMLLEGVRMDVEVLSIKPAGKELVYDFTEPETHWGYVNGVLAHNCAEITLTDRQVCNLTEVNLMAFVKEDGSIDYENLITAQRLSARMGYRMACVDMELHEWNKANKRDMLIGCSLTGIQDFRNVTKISQIAFESLLQQLRDVAHESANQLADELGKNRPLLATTVKPSGSVSLVMNGVSPGVHYSHSPYYIRRVRISANDPLLKVVRELEYPVFPEVGQEEETANTFVVEFPCKAPQGKTKENATADEQVDNYLTMMDNYVDHNVSITVSVRDNEWEDLTKRLYDEWDNVLAMSFMSLDDSFYQLMPYESITEEEYNKRKADMKPFNPNLISKYEEKYEEYDLGSDCDSGVCPVR